jgi:hypothetical protein
MMPKCINAAVLLVTCMLQLFVCAHTMQCDFSGSSGETYSSLVILVPYLLQGFDACRGDDVILIDAAVTVSAHPSKP